MTSVPTGMTDKLQLQGSFFCSVSTAKKLSLFLSAASVSSIFLKWVLLRVYAPILSPLIDLMSLFFHLVNSFFNFFHLSLTLSTLAVTVCARAASADESLIICRSEASSQPVQERCTDEQMPFKGNVYSLNSAYNAHNTSHPSLSVAFPLVEIENIR